jgi:alpha-D-xyloside xylohydrolase
MGRRMMLRSFARNMKKTSMFLVVYCVLLASAAQGQWNPLNPVVQVQQQPDGAVLTMKSGTLKLQVCLPALVRVMYSVTGTFPGGPDYVITKQSWPHTEWKLEPQADEVVLTTSKLKVSVARKDGAITFAEVSGKKLFTDNSRTLTPVTVNGEETYRAETFSSLWGSYEAFYGLGQHQAGVWNYRGEAVDLSQDNTNISIPFFLSSNGYGIYWNNNSRSRFNNRFLNALYLTSEAADVVDYYFMYGPEFDTIIAAYREMTGAPPMFGRWAYGFWQCKNRYRTQEEMVGVARKYRELHIPVDNIVQDWFWWNTMGEPTFDNTRYPDPKGMVDDLHKMNFHLMISVWPYFRPGSATYDDMDRRGFFIDRTKAPSFHPERMALYDAFDPEARKYYWKLMDDALFKIGADAWWLDTTEPETEGRETNVLVTNQTAVGNGARVANLFPLMTTTGVYEGQRQASSDKRVFILSRSAYSGAQRNAAAVWSGDINADWVFLKKQIPAGLNYSLSGLPYWTTDSGGFVSGNPNDPAYRELFVRWFQFSTFNPILRTHGTRDPDTNELWSYGPEAQEILVKFDRLRYRMLPYIYSLAWMTTHQGYTPMRAMAMDFRTDVRAANVGDQFMYGPALLVSPVTEPGATDRRLYLPQGRWYDFWSGTVRDGGKMITELAPLDRIPLFVRAGSILPLGPEMEWATQKTPDPMEVRVYAGADGNFNLYEDENDNYNYEKGSYATIPLHWDDGKQTLTVGACKGEFPGMLRTRTFRVVFVGEKHGAGVEASESADKVVAYAGQEVTVKR